MSRMKMIMVVKLMVMAWVLGACEDVRLGPVNDENALKSGEDRMAWTTQMVFAGECQWAADCEPGLDCLDTCCLSCEAEQWCQVECQGVCGTLTRDDPMVVIQGPCQFDGDCPGREICVFPDCEIVDQECESGVGCVVCDSQCLSEDESDGCKVVGTL